METTMSGLFPSVLTSVASAWSEWMLAMSWQVTVVALAIALIAMLGRRWPARFRYSLWLIVLVKLTLPPSLAAPTGFGWWLREGTDQVATNEPNVSSKGLVDPAFQDASEFTPLREVDTSGTSPEHSSTSRSAIAVPTPLTVNAASERAGWAVAALIAWSAIVAARLAFLIHAAFQVRSWVTRALPIRSPRVQVLLESARTKVGWRGKVDLRNSESCVTPLVVGHWRPTILLPSTVLERLDDAELESVLAHELVHLRRRDSWVRLATAVARTLYFFHPVAWWLGRELDRLREDACDESTVAALRGKRHAYGSALVKTAELLGYDAPHLALTALDRRFPVKERLLRVLDPNLPWLPPGRLARVCRWAAFGCITLVLLPAGAPRLAKQANAEWEGLTAAAAIRERSVVVEHPQLTDKSVANTPVRESPAVNTDAPPSDDLSRDLVARLRDPKTRHAAMESLVKEGAAVERALWPATMEVEPATRRGAYEVLEEVATVESLEWLERRYLIETGAEQAAAKRALDAVWRRIRQSVPMERGRREPVKFFESTPADQDDF
jgi:beta-lactamase regulating signal transducer with metallopeptidase domain